MDLFDKVKAEQITKNNFYAAINKRKKKFYPVATGNDGLKVVYELVDPRTGRVFFIGFGSSSQPYSHQRNFVTKAKGWNTNTAKAKIIGEIVAAGKNVKIRILQAGLEVEHAKQVAAYYILSTEGLTNQNQEVMKMVISGESRNSAGPTNSTSPSPQNPSSGLDHSGQ